MTYFVVVSFLSDIFVFICPDCEISVLTLLPLLQYNGGGWNVVCGAHCIELWHLNISTATCLSRHNVLVIPDNPQTSIVLGWRHIALADISKPVQIRQKLFAWIDTIGEEICSFGTWLNPLRVQMFKLKSCHEYHFSFLESSLLSFSTFGQARELYLYCTFHYKKTQCALH